MQARAAVARRKELAARLDALLGDDAAVLMPAVPGAAPRLLTPPEEIEPFYARLGPLITPAACAGMPQARDSARPCRPPWL